MRFSFVHLFVKTRCKEFTVDQQTRFYNNPKMLTTIIAICVVLFSVRIYLQLSHLWNREPFVWLTGNQWAVVTGSSDGIGFEFARQLAIKGYHLMLISRNEHKLNDAKQKILSEVNNSIQIRTLAVDFTSLDIYEKIDDFLNVHANEIYILANNVGTNYLYPNYFTNESTKEHLDLLLVNVIAATRMHELVLPSMLIKRRGLVLNVSSITGRQLFSLNSIYSASKVCHNLLI